jgi:hypothetical protein
MTASKEHFSLIPTDCGFYNDTGDLSFFADFEVMLFYHSHATKLHDIVTYAHSYSGFLDMFDHFMKYPVSIKLSNTIISITLDLMRSNDSIINYDNSSVSDDFIINNIMTLLNYFNSCMFFSNDMIYIIIYNLSIKKNNFIGHHKIYDITRRLFLIIDKCIERMDKININDKYLCYVSIGSLSKVKAFVKNGKKKK